jgi:endoglucanase
MRRSSVIPPWIALLAALPIWAFAIGLAAEAWCLDAPPSGARGQINPDPEALELLNASVKFYGAQRSGDGANWLLDGQSCFMRDGEQIGVDLSGGWFDAGDHLKATMSNAVPAYQMLKAYDAFGKHNFPDNYDQGYGPPNGVPDVLDEAQYALDWPSKVLYGEDRMVQNIGGFKYDHRTWATCSYKDDLGVSDGGQPRPINLDKDMSGQVTPKADIAGMAAAALALGSNLLRKFDPRRAGIYLQEARELYDYGQRHPDTSKGFYGQKDLGVNEWQDEMMCAAIELYRATDESKYLEDAKTYATIVKQGKYVPNWPHNSDYCRHSFFEVDEGDAVKTYWKQSIDRYRGMITDQKYVKGLLFPGQQWATLNAATGAAYSAALYYTSTGDVSARDLALSQLDYVMGDNEYDRSFVVGVGRNPPKNPHHSNAHGHNSNRALAERVPMKHELTGALVGGPTTKAAGGGRTQPGYRDDIKDYIGNENDTVYNDGLVGLAAFALSVGYDLQF